MASFPAAHLPLLCLPAGDRMAGGDAAGSEPVQIVLGSGFEIWVPGEDSRKGSVIPC